MSTESTIYRDHLKRAVAYIRANLTRPIRVSQIAAQVRLSAWHFARVFRRAFGETPLTMRDRLRVELAAEMLRKSDATLDKIAGVCGFRDRWHLTSTFKRVKDTTPGRYRQEAQNGR